MDRLRGEKGENDPRNGVAFRENVLLFLLHQPPPPPPPPPSAIGLARSLDTRAKDLRRYGRRKKGNSDADKLSAGRDR